MAWIKSYQSLAMHRKTLLFAGELGTTRFEAIGLVHCFWWWAIDSVPSGHLGGLPASVVATACGWQEVTEYWANEGHGPTPLTPSEFVAALARSGFVDPPPCNAHGNAPCVTCNISPVTDHGVIAQNTQIHNFLEYTADLTDPRDKRREATRLRVKRYREREKQNSSTNSGENGNAVSNADVTHDSNADVTHVTLAEESRLKKTMGTGAAAPKHKPHLTETETAELHAEYDAALTADRVTSEIAASLDHVAAYKRGKSGSWKLYVQTWLCRAAAPPAVFRPAPPSANGSAPSSPGKPPPIWLPSMGEQHKGPDGMVKACGVPGCKVPICLVPPPRRHEAEERFKERLAKVVAADGAESLDLGQGRTVAPR